MSSLLFAHYSEPLCRSVRNCSIMRGYHPHSEQVKVIANADDVAFFCEDTPSVDQVSYLSQQISDATRTMLNTSKGSGLWFVTGPRLQRSSPESLVHAQHHFVGECHCTQFVTAVRNGRHRAASLCGQQHSIFGCATACNVILATRVYCVLQVLHCARTNIQNFHLFQLLCSVQRENRCGGPV